MLGTRVTKRVGVGWASLPSDAHRTRNEDSFLVLPERGFFGVFDGMGGRARADRVAAIAAETVQETLLPLASDASGEAVADTIRDAFFAADEAVRAAEAFQEGPEGAGTTAVVVLLRPLRPSGWSAFIGWVGDSRANLLAEGTRSLRTLTLDDGVVRLHASSAAQARKYQDALGAVTDPRRLSLRERDFFLERHVLIQAVGTSLRHVHLIEHELGDRDQLVLTTDGVHDNLTDREVTALLRRSRTAGEAAHALVNASRSRSRHRDHLRAKPDDMTAIIVRLGVNS